MKGNAESILVSVNFACLVWIILKLWESGPMTVSLIPLENPVTRKGTH